MKNSSSQSNSSNRSRSAPTHPVVTLEMVARMAGVSPSTVSRILNGTAVVSAIKKAAVEAAIAQLGFVPNPVARGLAGGRTFSIGVITQAIDSPFYGMALSGIEHELDRVGYSALYVSGEWNAKEEAKCIDVLRSRRVDGIIVLTGRLTDKALKDCAKTMPLVVTGRTLKAPGLYSLNFDNFEGGRLATQHLIDLGHRRIVFINGVVHHADASERLRGYRAALESAGLAYDPDLVVPGDFREAGGLNAVNQLLDRQITFSAIFAANDQMAFGAALGLYRHGLRVPDDVSLVGFDDLPVSMYALPPLTSVHESADELGGLAAHSMLQILDGETPTGQVPAPFLMVRESSKRLVR
ncbi:MAG: transcriptional regulator [Comamonadaceae bacterium CG12_big_fil_rev_8_21_14_0_65_59_15]|nr:MAG: transcriptional regulator [Comamonadaceae bacterium CG12_big_fil_rev_8_21_14_0_65_59_15]